MLSKKAQMYPKVSMLKNFQNQFQMFLNQQELV